MLSSAPPLSYVSPRQEGLGGTKPCAALGMQALRMCCWLGMAVAAHERRELPTTRKNAGRVEGGGLVWFGLGAGHGGAHGGSREALPAEGAGTHLTPGGQSRKRALRRRAGAGRELRGALGGHFGGWKWDPWRDRGLLLLGEDLRRGRDASMAAAGGGWKSLMSRQAGQDKVGGVGEI